MTTNAAEKTSAMTALTLLFALSGCAAAPQATCPPQPQPPQELVREAPQDNRKKLDSILKSAEISAPSSTP
jgi:starvation-inducible outer membrane lipoprotein